MCVYSYSYATEHCKHTFEITVTLLWYLYTFSCGEDHLHGNVCTFRSNKFSKTKRAALNLVPYYLVRYNQLCLLSFNK